MYLCDCIILFFLGSFLKWYVFFNIFEYYWKGVCVYILDVVYYMLLNVIVNIIFWLLNKNNFIFNFGYIDCICSINILLL